MKVQQAAESGLFPINTFRRSDENGANFPCSMEGQKVVELKTLPYFDNMKAQAAKIIEVYCKNADVINHLSQKKSELYNYMTKYPFFEDSNTDHLHDHENGAKCLTQKELQGSYCQKDTMSYNEYLKQKQSLSEWLGQDDFFGENNGKAGFRRPEAQLLSQLSMMYSRDKASSSSNGFKKRTVKSRNNS